MSWTGEVVAALAEHIAAAGMGTWRPTGVYAATETGIVVKAMPPTPNRVIVISPYPVAESAHLSDLTLGLQLRCRGSKDPRDVDEMADDLRELLHGARGLVLGPARIAHLWRQSHASTGVHANDRWTTSSNFYAQTAQATAHAGD